MKRILTVLLAAGTLAGAAVATSAPAEARWRGGWGWGLGGFAAGAIVGGAVTCVWRRIWNGYAWVRACI